MNSQPNGPTAAASIAKRTLLGVVIDKSGSMANKTNDVIDGFNRFLQEQKRVPGSAYMVVTLFDTSVASYADSSIQDVHPIDHASYVAGGSTALLDAVDEAIGRLDRAHQSGDRVIVVVMTDGEENASKRTTLKQIKSKITDRRGQGWEFVFLGADENAWAQAGPMGFSAASVGAYADSPAGTRVAYSSMSSNVSAMRKTGASADTLSWNTEKDGPRKD